MTITTTRAARPTAGWPPRSLPPTRPRRRVLAPYALIAAAVLLELVIHVVPILMGIASSVLKLNQNSIATWWAAPVVGADNFAATVAIDSALGESFWRSLGVTAAFTVVVVVASWLLGTLAAVFLQTMPRVRRVVQSVFLIPYALPAFTGIMTWNLMLQRDSGAVNVILSDQLGLIDGHPFWLVGPNAFWWLCVVATWRLWPFVFIIVVSALQSVPTDVYEAGALDGAGPWRSLRSITLPLIAPVNRVLLLVLTLWTFNDFTTPFLLFGSTPPPEADLLALHIYNTSFGSWNFGAGAAMSVMLMVVLSLLALMFLTLTRRRHAHLD